MPLTTRTLTGTIQGPNGAVASNWHLTFELVPVASTGTGGYSGADTDVVSPIEVTTTTDGNGAFSVDLWPNDSGEETTRYQVFLRKTAGARVRDRFLIAVPAGSGSYTLAEARVLGSTGAATITPSIEAIKAQAEAARDQALAAEGIETLSLATGQSVDIALSDYPASANVPATARWQTPTQEDTPSGQTDVASLQAGDGDQGAATPNRVLRLTGQAWLEAQGPSKIVATFLLGSATVEKVYLVRFAAAGGAAEIGPGDVGTVELADAGVTTAKVADAAITTGKIADGAITTGKIPDDAITEAKLGADVDGLFTARPTKEEAGYTYIREEYSSREHVPTRVLLPGQRRSWVWTSDEKRKKPLFWVDGDQYADEVAQEGDYLKTLTAPVTVTSAEETADALSAIVAASGGSPLTVAFPAAVSDIPAAVLGSQLWPAPDIYNTWHATPDTASANGTTISSGQSLLVVHTGTAPTNDIENGFIVGPDTSNAGDWSLYLVPIDAAADAVGRLHKGFFAMREKQSTSGGGIVLAYDSVTGNYLWAGVRANSNLSVGVSVSGSDTTIGSGTLGTNGHRGINGEMRAALNERFSTLQQFVRVQFWANLNTDISGNANALAIIAAATHVGVFLHRDSLAQSYASRLARP